MENLRVPPREAAIGNGCWAPRVRARRAGALKIATPTLMVTASRDVRRDSDLEDYGRLPNASLQVFHRCGHMIANELPDETAALIADFMEYGVVHPAGV